MDIAHGKQADVFPELESPLTPFGPSDILMLGIPFLSINRFADLITKLHAPQPSYLFI